MNPKLEQLHNYTTISCDYEIVKAIDSNNDMCLQEGEEREIKRGKGRRRGFQINPDCGDGEEAIRDFDREADCD
ncbi:hypothetical protein SESBI_27530 [Sesbania bispinosa]|nr:hypothetical protein SESBI_27530 [Sesbania bispinosa]